MASSIQTVFGHIQTILAIVGIGQLELNPEPAPLLVVLLLGDLEMQLFAPWAPYRVPVFLEVVVEYIRSLGFELFWISLMFLTGSLISGRLTLTGISLPLMPGTGSHGGASHLSASLFVPSLGHY